LCFATEGPDSQMFMRKFKSLICAKNLGRSSPVGEDSTHFCTLVIGTCTKIGHSSFPVNTLKLHFVAPGFKYWDTGLRSTEKRELELMPSQSTLHLEFCMVRVALARLCHQASKPAHRLHNSFCIQTELGILDGHRDPSRQE
jgi:hypothetical protein